MTNKGQQLGITVACTAPLVQARKTKAVGLADVVDLDQTAGTISVYTAIYSYISEFSMVLEQGVRNIIQEDVNF